MVVGDHAGLASQLAVDGLTFTGVVPDPTVQLDAAAVVVAPIRLGGGMRLKALEALSSGKALVAYPAAVEGLAVEDGDQLAIAHGPDEFAALVVELLGDRDRRVRLGAAAFEWALGALDWRPILDAWDELYRRLTCRRDAPELRPGHAPGRSSRRSRASARAPDPPRKRGR